MPANTLAELERAKGEVHHLEEKVAALEARDGEMEAKLIETVLEHRKRADLAQETLQREREVNPRLGRALRSKPDSHPWCDAGVG